MRVLVLGQGKTGKLVAEVAAEHGHGVDVLDEKENTNATALTPPFLSGFDVVIDFTTPEAVVQNLRACLATGAKVVVGTTGWYGKLQEMRQMAERKNAGLLYGTNFSIGVQVTMELVKRMGEALKGAGYTYSLTETHHTSKLDAPSGTALTMQQALAEVDADGAKFEIVAHRVGDANGLHMLEAKSDADRIVLTHEAFSRRGFAEGAVRAAEWLSTRTGCYDFRDVYTECFGAEKKPLPASAK
ncbi:MAG TPA: 4-hydroxy-tetrahydrodipicolinate reductase [Acidobacteriaceae bacterium]